MEPAPALTSNRITARDFLDITSRRTPPSHGAHRCKGVARTTTGAELELHFDSKAERERWLVLMDARARGEIREVLTHTPTMRLFGGQTYTADFLVVHNDGTFHVEDVKGHPTREWKVKWNTVQGLHPHMDFRAVYTDEIRSASVT